MSIPICIQCDTKYQSKVCCHEFWYILSDFDAQLEQTENENAACEKWVQVCKKR